VGAVISFFMFGGFEGIQEMQEEILREIQENQ
jgi:hypothetical protein